MRVEVRTVLAATVLVATTMAVGSVACGGGQPEQQPAPATVAPPAPKVLTAAERATWYQGCWNHFTTKAWDQFKTCYADVAESEQVDSGQPMAKGIDAVVASARQFADAFPDIKGNGQLILINGDTLVSVYLLNGTHTGPLPGPDGKSIPATNKPIGLLQAHWIRTDSTGAKVVKEAFYMDSGTMMAQLGINPTPARPVMQNTSTAPVVAIASGTAVEQSNVEALQAQMAAFNRQDAAGANTAIAPDGVFHEMAAPKDMTAKENLASTRDMFKAFPDAHLVQSSLWGAGDYVVTLGRFEGTNKGPMPAMGLKKATGKAVQVRFLEVSRWENGKIKDDWLFYDGMAFAGQLGLLAK